ncbi:MAG: hypothetical protein MUF51_05315 [Vicinamibacteria bacterium]|jgi:hypothetical protein|nr:hypothetical protein [Vicinamibacteria bacterium]
MNTLLASLLSAVLRLQNDVVAFVLTAFFGLALCAFLQAALGDRLLPARLRKPPRFRIHARLIVLGFIFLGLFFLACGALYAVFVLNSFQWTIEALSVVATTLLVLLGALAARRVTGFQGPRGIVGLLVQVVVVLIMLILALVTLMRAGFLGLTEDRPVLLVEVTGATGEEVVKWTPPNGTPRMERLATHQVRFLRPDDLAQVGEGWIYGDEVAIKGRVLRLTPLLNAAGIANLFELQFAFNGYRTAERHNEFPHHALPLPPMGPLAVHPLWRKLQTRLLQRWESGTADGSYWLIRSTTTESTFFPLTDSADQPIKRTYRLTMTPGGLSAS